MPLHSVVGISIFRFETETEPYFGRFTTLTPGIVCAQQLLFQCKNLPISTDWPRRKTLEEIPPVAPRLSILSGPCCALLAQPETNAPIKESAAKTKTFLIETSFNKDIITPNPTNLITLTRSRF